MARSINWLSVALIVALVVGVALRTVQFRQIPPGLYHDEAYTGIDALRTLQDGPRMYYDSSFGREPLFTWLVAVSIHFLGVSPLATRFPSLIVGVLTLLTCYGMSRALFNRRVGVLATAVLAVTLWHVHFSRISFRAILMPLFASISVWQVARGVRTAQRLPWALGGAAAGALLYTYISARLMLLAVALFLLYVGWRQRSFRLPYLRQGMLFAAAAAVVMAPFILYTLFHWEQVLLRTQNVESIFNRPEPLKMLFNNVLGALGMFNVRGDFQYRHNVPLRPVFDPALGVMFLLGLGLVVRRWRRDPVAPFLLIWMGTLLIPTILTKDSPHFIRSLGILPFAVLFPALGLDWTWDKLSQRYSTRRASVALLLIFAIGLGSTVQAYFLRYPSFPETCYWLECAGVEMAADINGFLEKGWTPDAWVVGDRPGRTDRQVYVQFQLWKDFVNAHFLIPDSPGFNVPGERFVTSRPPQPDLDTLFYGWYNKHYPDFWMPDLVEWVPPRSLIKVYEGPWATTAQDRSPHPAYLKFVAMPNWQASCGCTPLVPAVTSGGECEPVPGEPQDGVPLAELDQGVSLACSCTSQRQEEIIVRLVWHNRESLAVDYTIFVHYERDGQIIAQADGPPAPGYHPTSHWRPGDYYLDERALAVPGMGQAGDRIWVGMYQWQTGERLPVLTATAATQDNRIAIDMQSCE